MPALPTASRRDVATDVANGAPRDRKTRASDRSAARGELPCHILCSLIAALVALPACGRVGFELHAQDNEVVDGQGALALRAIRRICATATSLPETPMEMVCATTSTRTTTATVGSTLKKYNVAAIRLR